MLPISPITLGVGVLMALFRPSLSGVLFGGMLALAGMHLWPDQMQVVYDWVGEILNSFGLLEA